MSPWRPLVRGIRALLRPSEADRETDEELRTFLEHAEAERVATGVPSTDARRALRLEYGSSLALREDGRFQRFCDDLGYTDYWRERGIWPDEFVRGSLVPR